MHTWHLTTNYLCGRATFKSLNVLRALRSNHRLLADKLSPAWKNRAIHTEGSSRTNRWTGLSEGWVKTEKERNTAEDQLHVFGLLPHFGASPCFPLSPVKCTFTSIMIHVPTANECMQQHSTPYKATTVTSKHR
jgi:hypothetical protein